jgi:hypothetical protein
MTTVKMALPIIVSVGWQRQIKRDQGAETGCIGRATLKECTRILLPVGHGTRTSLGHPFPNVPSF